MSVILKLIELKSLLKDDSDLELIDKIINKTFSYDFKKTEKIYKKGSITSAKKSLRRLYMQEYSSFNEYYKDGCYKRNLLNYNYFFIFSKSECYNQFVLILANVYENKDNVFFKESLATAKLYITKEINNILKKEINNTLKKRIYETSKH